jgi:hypothetical protein
MDVDILKYEVQRIDGTPESVFRAIDLLIGELKRPELDYLPKSIEYGFFEEFYKCLINWMTRGEFDHLKLTYTTLKEKIRTDDAFVSPFAGSSSKRRFGASLNVLNEIIEVYLRSDLEIKDVIRILGTKKNQKRHREVLAQLYELQHKAPITVASVNELPEYGRQDVKQTSRDLDDLEKMGFLLKEKLSSKNIQYRLTLRAFRVKEKIEKKIAEDKLKEVAVPVSAPGDMVDPVAYRMGSGMSSYNKVLQLLQDAKAKRSAKPEAMKQFEKSTSDQSAFCISKDLAFFES